MSSSTARVSGCCCSGPIPDGSPSSPEPAGLPDHPAGSPLDQPAPPPNEPAGVPDGRSEVTVGPFRGRFVAATRMPVVGAGDTAEVADPIAPPHRDRPEQPDL